MEFVVDLAKPPDIVSIGQCRESIVDGLKSLKFLCSQFITGTMCGVAFEDTLDGVKILDLFCIELADHGSPAGNDRQISFGFQLTKCLADRSAADAVPFCQIRLRYPAAGF